jgi:hypothetical protein
MIGGKARACCIKARDVAQGSQRAASNGQQTDAMLRQAAEAAPAAAMSATMNIAA